MTGFNISMIIPCAMQRRLGGQEWCLSAGQDVLEMVKVKQHLPVPKK